jgi:hypothetical protein
MGKIAITSGKEEMRCMQEGTLDYWEVWDPRAAATGILIARGHLKRTDTLILHAAPDIATVEVSDAHGRRLAYGADLRRTLESPMCRFRRDGESITREDIWPTEEDIGSLVMLPGGEVGTLMSWWHAEDRMEWRWQVEFYNSRRGGGNT